MPGVLLGTSVGGLLPLLLDGRPASVRFKHGVVATTQVLMACRLPAAPTGLWGSHAGDAKDGSKRESGIWHHAETQATIRANAAGDRPSLREVARSCLEGLEPLEFQSRSGVVAHVLGRGCPSPQIVASASDSASS